MASFLTFLKGRIQTLRKLDGQEISAEERERVDALFCMNPQAGQTVHQYTYAQSPVSGALPPGVLLADGALKQGGGVRVPIKLTSMTFDALTGIGGQPLQASGGPSPPLQVVRDSKRRWQCCWQCSILNRFCRCRCRCWIEGFEEGPRTSACRQHSKGASHHPEKRTSSSPTQLQA